MIRIFRRLALPSLLLWAALPALAFDANGIWYTDAGAVVRIASDSSNVTIRWDNNGKAYEYRGWWMHTGETFTYEANSGTVVGTFLSRDKLRFTSSKGTWMLTRGGASQSHSAPAPVNITGLWKSDSGSSVQVNSQGNQVTITFIDVKGNRRMASGRWIEQGRKFDYSVPGYPGVAICTVAGVNRIDVVYGSKVNTWVRQ